MNYRQRKYNEGQSARNDIYRFLVKYFEKHGYMPSYEEIMDGTDLTKCTVQRHIRQLEMDSLIATEHPGVSRAYRLTEYRYERKNMGSKLKMKAPKKNRVLECDNQMSQAFARAMQNSRKELEIMQDQAYNDGFNTGDDWANTINSVTMMLALRKLHGFSTKRLLDVINCANEFVGQANRGERSFMSMIEELESETDVRIPDLNKELVRRFGV